MRKKKTPEELAAEAEQEDLDDFTSKFYFHFHSFVISLIFYRPPLVLGKWIRIYIHSAIKTKKSVFCIYFDINRQSVCQRRGSYCWVFHLFVQRLIALLRVVYFFISELKNTIETQVNEIKTQLESKCVLQ